MTLNDLIALNDEMAALVRAGVPLERGLADLGADLPGRLGRIAATLAERTARGESLDQAMTSDSLHLPPAYRAVVQAGVRAGRLPAALEAVASSARRLAETHRAAVVAATYPLLVVVTAWCGLVFFACVLAPRLATKYGEFGVPSARLFAVFSEAGRSAWWWGPLLPILLMLIVAAWWRAGSRAGAIQGDWANRLLGFIPWMGPMLRSSRAATFLEMLALLVENQTPLQEAMPLAAEASGDPRTMRAARRVAAAIQNGETMPRPGDPAFPPLMNWLLASAQRDGALLPALRHAATTYHRRARYQSDLLRLLLPVALTVVIAGGATAAYALALFVPYVSLIRALGG